jgi:multiple sugar transport system permease protein
MKWLLTSANWQNYVDAAAQLDYPLSLQTSILVAVLCTIGHVCSCSMIAYGLTRFRFRGRNLLVASVILTILIPPQILQIPLYIQYAKIGWIGTILPMVIPSFFGGGLNGGLFIFIFMQFFRGIPKDYEEAAKMEGCGHFYIFSRIIMPISKSAIVVVTTLSMIWHWNDIFESVAFLNGTTKTLMQQLSVFPTYMYENTTAEGLTVSLVEFAACVLTLIPIMVFLLLIQKKFINSADHSGLSNM